MALPTRKLALKIPTRNSTGHAKPETYNFANLAGIKVSYTYVYALKSKGKAKKRKEKREKAVAASNSMGVLDPVDLIRQVKELALRTGGLRNLRQLVDVLVE